MALFGTQPKPDYDWENLSSSYQPEEGGRGIGVWVTAALGVSALLHLVLFAFAGKIDWSKYGGKATPVAAVPEERVAINPELLKKGEVIKDLTIEEERVDSSLADIDEDLSLLEAQEQLKEKEIRLTPEIDKPENYLAEEGTPRPAVAAEDLLRALEAIETSGGVERSLENDVAAMKKRMSASGRISENQLMLEAGPDLGLDHLEDDLLKEFEGTPSGAGSGVQGFSDLDKLLSMTGGLPANLDPVLMPTELLFGYNEIQVKESARLSLMKLGMLIQKNPDSDFAIEGHSDSFGGAEYNQKLSEQRANAVRDWLVNSLRLDGTHITALGRGQSNHLVSADGDKEAQALNRRVEIVIKPRKKGRKKKQN